MRMQRAATDLGARHRDAAAVLAQHAHGGPVGRAECGAHDATGEERDVMPLLADRGLVAELVRGIDARRE